MGPGSSMPCSSPAPGDGAAWPLGLAAGLFLDAPCTTQDHSLTELGVVFCLPCHKRLILWRVLEGSEIHFGVS